MKKTVYQELMLLERKAQTLWNDVRDVGKRQPAIKDDEHYLALRVSLSDFLDMLHNLAEDQKPMGSLGDLARAMQKEKE